MNSVVLDFVGMIASLISLVMIITYCFYITKLENRIHDLENKIHLLEWNQKILRNKFKVYEFGEKNHHDDIN